MGTVGRPRKDERPAIDCDDILPPASTGPRASRIPTISAITAPTMTAPISVAHDPREEPLSSFMTLVPRDSS
jgi:hypothetical protein